MNFSVRVLEGATGGSPPRTKKVIAKNASIATRRPLALSGRKPPASLAEPLTRRDLIPKVYTARHEGSLSPNPAAIEVRIPRRADLAHPAILTARRFWVSYAASRGRAIGGLNHYRTIGLGDSGNQARHKSFSVNSGVTFH